VKKVLASLVIALLSSATLASPVSACTTADCALDILPGSEVDAIAADNALFAATDTSPIDPTTGRQTISVSFFAGHIGPVQNGYAHWTNTDSNDSDPYSAEIIIREGTGAPDYFSSFAGINFHHAPPAPPVNAPSFDFKADRTGASGGSPRLVMVFSDHGNINLRPLDWVQNTWISEGPGDNPDPLFATNWDSNGGTCIGFQYEKTYQQALACHPGATVTAAFITSDSGWMYNTGYMNWIDNIQYDGTIISQPPDNANP
jgi:hypothetical protein